MASLKLFLFSLTLIFSHVNANIFFQESAEYETEPPQIAALDADSDSLALKIELDQLNSRIHTLESHVSEKSQEVKKKDEIIAEKEKIIQDRLSSIDSLQNEIASLEIGKAYAGAGELQKQVDKLKGELEKQNKENVALEILTTEAEKKIHDLDSKLEDLQKINEEHKTKIHKAEHALKVAEEEMVKAKLEDTSRTKELMEVQGAWLPPWLAVRFVLSKSFIETHWNELGKPALEVITQKALEKKAQARKWAEPHLETIRTEAKKFSEPYIDQVALAAKPHVDKIRVALKPYTRKVVLGYGKFLESATFYHCQVQATVQETLKKHELTPLATKELEWFAASALLALQIILLARVLSAIFCKKVKKPSRSGSTHHARRKTKQWYPDK